MSLSTLSQMNDFFLNYIILIYPSSVSLNHLSVCLSNLVSSFNIIHMWLHSWLVTGDRITSQGVHLKMKRMFPSLRTQGPPAVVHLGVEMRFSLPTLAHELVKSLCGSYSRNHVVEVSWMGLPCNGLDVAISQMLCCSSVSSHPHIRPWHKHSY